MNSSSCSIDDFKRSVFPAVYLLIFILGVVGHSVSLYVFVSLWRKKRSLTSINLFMVNLLVSDLMQVCSLPFRVSYYLSDSKWLFGPIACRLISYIFYLNMYGSIYFMAFLNIMRYLALVRPYLFKRLQSCGNGRVVCLFIWLFVMLASSPLLIMGGGTGNSTDTCMELPKDHSFIEILSVINNATLAVGFVVPTAVILWCSIFVARGLLRPGPTRRMVNTSRKKSGALVIISLGIFMISFLPYHVTRLVFLQAEIKWRLHNSTQSCDHIEAIRKAAVITLCLGTANTCLDPILFFFVGENVRGFFRKLLRSEDRSLYQQRAELQVLQT
ncbi:cysteinyl leukotriene receptor 2 [Brachyhypopomus gauderio]|uniref:cysteinyl leukotriene receptor 2 n=1 Tax=Brachyhypopomus gauderio TaxID=698409 RepID=UPI0040427160